MDTREIRFNEAAGDFPLRALGSLREFKNLKTVVLSEVAIFANEMAILDEPGQECAVRISETLPVSVETFAILLNAVLASAESSFSWPLEDVRALMDFANDCQEGAFPKLPFGDYAVNGKLPRGQC